MVLTLQLEHLVHLLDGRIMMQKWQWHGMYVIVITIPNHFDYIFLANIYMTLWASLCGLLLIRACKKSRYSNPNYFMFILTYPFQIQNTYFWIRNLLDIFFGFKKIQNQCLSKKIVWSKQFFVGFD